MSTKQQLLDSVVRVSLFPIQEAPSKFLLGASSRNTKESLSMLTYMGFIRF